MNASFAELPVKEIQQLASFNAWLFYRSDAPVRVAARPAHRVPEFAGLAGGA